MDQSGSAQKPLSTLPQFWKRLCLGLKYLILSAQTWLENVPLPSKNIQRFCVPKCWNEVSSGGLSLSCSRVNQPWYEIYCGNVLKHRNLTNLWFAVKHNATILFRQLGWFSLVGTLTKHSFPLTPSFLCACQKFRVVVIMTKAAPPASHTAYGVLTGQLFKPCQESLFLDNPAYDGDMIRHKCRSQPKCSQTKWRIMNLKL